MLTDVAIRKIKPTPQRQEIRDEGAPGLYLLVQPSGARSWAVRYSRGGRVLKTTLGGYPAVSLGEARKQALTIAASVAGGADPQAERRAAREPVAVRTVRIVADEFLRLHTDRKNGDRWAAEARRILAKDILPLIGDKAIGGVGKPEINDVLDAKGDTPIAANRTLAVLRKLYRWSLGRGYVDRDPTAGVSKPGAETKRDRVLSDAEAARVWCAAVAMPYPFGIAVRMLILTGARREEVGAMRWSEVDLAEKTWTLPASRSKNDVEHVVPLSASAVALLRDLPRIGRSDFVFTTTGTTAVSGWSRAKATLDTTALMAMQKEDPKAEPLTRWTIHDLRRTVATGLQRLGMRLEVTEAVLGHVSGSKAGVMGVYQKYAWADEKREALDLWAAHVAKIVGE